MNYQDFFNGSFNVETGELNMTQVEKSTAKDRVNTNILLMGASGVGKSTLVNAIFGEDIARTGVGQPVTQGLSKYYFEKKGLTLWDTKGIEAKDYRETMDTIHKELKDAFEFLEEKKAPHIAWLCIKESSDRVEDRELELIKIAKDFGIPTVVVFTNTQFEKGDAFVEEAKRIIDKDFGSFIKNRYVRVNSSSYSMMGMTIPPKGLDELVVLSEGCFSEADKNVRNHFIKIQKVNNRMRLEAMKECATTVVNMASAAAAVAGGSPIPGSDAPIIAGIQSTMIYKINSNFEVSLTTSASTTLMAGILGTTALATVGKTIVANVLKFIPVAGSILGGGISATTAAVLTKAVGETYIAVLSHYYNEDTGNVELPDGVDSILHMFKNIFNPTLPKHPPF